MRKATKKEAKDEKNGATLLAEMEARQDEVNELVKSADSLPMGLSNFLSTDTPLRGEAANLRVFCILLSNGYSFYEALHLSKVTPYAIHKATLLSTDFMEFFDGYVKANNLRFGILAMNKFQDAIEAGDWPAVKLALENAGFVESTNAKQRSSDISSLVDIVKLADSKENIIEADAKVVANVEG